MFKNDPDVRYKSMLIGLFAKAILINKKLFTVDDNFKINVAGSSQSPKLILQPGEKDAQLKDVTVEVGGAEAILRQKYEIDIMVNNMKQVDGGELFSKVASCVKGVTLELQDAFERNDILGFFDPVALNFYVMCKVEKPMSKSDLRAYGFQQMDINVDSHPYQYSRTIKKGYLVGRQVEPNELAEYIEKIKSGKP